MSLADNNKIIQEKERRLQKLKERQAREGISTPPEVLIEIEDLERELAALKNPPDDSTPPPSRDADLDTLLDNVHKIWIDDYLNSALLRAIYIDLGLRLKRDAVPQPFADLNMRLLPRGEVEQNLPPGTTIYDVYQQARGSLLILGMPGAGKTTMLANLARDLIIEAERDATARVPVIFNLSSWATEQKPLGEWLADELTRRYQVSHQTALQWLAAERLTLLLDGLDEVAENRRPGCVAVINAYADHEDTGPLVVCSRLDDYKALQQQLNLRQAIVLNKLTREQVERYFRRLVAEQPAFEARLVRLFEQIWADEALRDLSETPLMLNIITVTYAHPDAPPLPEGEGESLRDQIFAAYSQRMLNRMGRSQRELHPPETTLRHLYYLASRLEAHGLTQFSIGQMRGSWLPVGLRYQYFLLDRLIFGLSVGLSVGLSTGLIFGLSEGILIGLSGGLIGGLIGTEEDSAESLRWGWRSAMDTLGGSVLGGLFSGVSTGLLAQAGITLPDWLVVGLSGGLILGLVRGVLGGLIVGAILVLIFGPGGGLLGGLLFGLFGGLSAAPISRKTDPEQELTRSRRSMLLCGLSGGLLFGLFFGLLGGLFFGLFGGGVFGLFGGLQCGGAFLTQHYLRLWLLNRNGLLPWEFIAFLNHVTELIFLQRLGGSYRFIHRSLQEYFAKQWKSQHLRK